MNKVVVTGGSGFVGRHVIKALLERYPHIEITSVSRSESMISSLLMECPASTRLRLKLADIRDRHSMRDALHGVDTVLHLAAMKRVDLSEQQCREAATINVLGTLNILDAFNGNTFVFQSTDKAVEPCNCYGATKMVAEKMVMQRAATTKKARYMIIRSGNILGSTGSVLDIWKHQIEQRNQISVTDPDMKRFYVSIHGVVQLYLAMLQYGQNGKLYFTPRGDAVILRDLVSQTLKLYGNKNTKVNYTGLRPGERMEEKMRSENETNTVSGFEKMIEYIPEEKERVLVTQ